MTGFVFVTGRCVACKVPITFSPTHVPSLRLNGVREPLCRGCHALWNKIHRTDKGLEPVPLHPQAYEPEPCP